MLVVTLGDLGRAQLRALQQVLGLDDNLHLAVFDALSASWAHRSLAAAPPACDITDDRTPFEFSLAFDGDVPELRMLVEAGGWAAGLALGDALRARFGASLDRLDAIADLFEPGGDGRFALWHAVAFTASGPTFKVYVDPAARGEPRACVERALGRLGLANAWGHIAATLRAERDQPIYFSLDLADHEARVKVYIAHAGADPARIDEVVAGAGEACVALAGPGPYGARPILTCIAFVADAPCSVTVHVPIRCYVPSDAIAVQRIARFLAPAAAAQLDGAARCLARRPLDRRSGIVTYASLRYAGERRRVTIYLAPEAYAP